MGSSLSPLLPLLLLLCMFSALAVHSSADSLGIYWGGQSNNNLPRTSLRRTCKTNHFHHVNIAFLNNFGNGRAPRPDLGSSCNAEAGECKRLQEDISFCQSQGVRVLLSIGGFDINSYTLASAQEAHRLAAHVYNVYLSGNGIDGPLGKVKLDGVDFFINDGSESHYWDVLAQDLKNLDNNIILTASQGCNHRAGVADMPLYNALKTGLFDKVWPRYFGQPCIYDQANTDAFEASVNSWTSEFKNIDFFLGLIANSDESEEGFIRPKQFPQALEIARRQENYRGVMLWNRHLDEKYRVDTNSDRTYSDKIYPILSRSIKKCVTSACRRDAAF